MYISTRILTSKNVSSASKWRSSQSLAEADATKCIRIHTVAAVGECLVHPFDVPEPLSGKSTSVLLDLAALHLSFVNHPGPNHELVNRSSHLPFLISPNFPPLFHLQRVHRYLPVYCSGDMPLAIGSGSSTFL